MTAPRSCRAQRAPARGAAVAALVALAGALGCGDAASADDASTDTVPADAAGVVPDTSVRDAAAGDAWAPPRDAEHLPPPDALVGDTAGDDGDGAAPTPPTPTDVVVMFHINVQDYGYVDLSAASLTRALDLFDEVGLPVDVYLTTWMVDAYEAQHPALLERLLTSPRVSVNYHLRPPLPYSGSGIDWAGLSQLDAEGQYDAIMNYETHGLDLVTGQPTAAEGGFAKLKRLYGRAPYAGGINAPAPLAATVRQVFADLGLTFVARHGSPSVLGDRSGPLYIKPEAIDVRAFRFQEEGGDTCLTETDGAALYDCEVARCDAVSQRPCVIAFKLHDNDFFATQSWWTLVYAHQHNPPWDPTQQAELLPQSAQDLIWDRYEQIVRRAAEVEDAQAVFGARDWAALLPP